MTRNIRARIELDNIGLAKGHRYVVKTGNGMPLDMATLAHPSDRFSTPAWSMLLGKPCTDLYSTSNTQCMYIQIYRQYPNPDFDINNIDSYSDDPQWLDALIEVASFRLYNPWIGYPSLDWAHADRWESGDSYSENEQHQYSYTINEYAFKHNEKDVPWTVKRLSDSDNYKEWIIRLSV